MKQTFHNKGGGGIGGGLATEEWEQFYEFDSTKIKNFPFPAESALKFAKDLDNLGIARTQLSPRSLLQTGPPQRDLLAAAKIRAGELLQQMISA
jgi:hypothetical protein